MSDIVATIQWNCGEEDVLVDNVWGISNGDSKPEGISFERKLSGFDEANEYPTGDIETIRALLKISAQQEYPVSDVYSGPLLLQHSSDCEEIPCLSDFGTQTSMSIGNFEPSVSACEDHGAEKLLTDLIKGVKTAVEGSEEMPLNQDRSMSNEKASDSIMKDPVMPEEFINDRMTLTSDLPVNSTLNPLAQEFSMLTSTLLVNSNLNPSAQEFIMKNESWLRRKQLYDILPAVDIAYLDKVFESNRSCLESSLIYLRKEIKRRISLPKREYNNALAVSIKKPHNQVLDSDEWVFNLVDCGFETDVVDVIDLHYPHGISREAKKLRQLANSHFVDYQGYLIKAIAAFYKGDKEETLRLTEKRIQRQEKFWRLNRQASQIIIQQNNESGQPCICNVNGLSASEAVFYLQKFLTGWQKTVRKHKSDVITKVHIEDTSFVPYKQNIFSSIVKFLGENNYRHKKTKNGIKIKIKAEEKNH